MDEPNHQRKFKRQAGVVLIVSLVLLLIVTVLGLSAMRGTTTQQKMTSNFYDREVSFQGAEAALRAAGVFLYDKPDDPSIRDCSIASNTTCLGNPFTDSGLPSSSLITVTSTQFQASAVAMSQPQYVIEKLGVFSDFSEDSVGAVTANSQQEDKSLSYGGVDAGAQTHNFYRITARSGDPSLIGDRSVVILQAVVKQ